MDLNVRTLLAPVLLLLSIGGCAPLPSGEPAAPRAEPLRYAGAYAGDLFWEGRVVMAGDVLILAGGSLTIRAGTEVLVEPAEGTQIDPDYLSSQTELLVRGRLDSAGTGSAPVRFLLVDPDVAESYAWAGITLDRAGDSRIVQTEISRADTAIRLVASSPLIEGNRIVGNRYGIIVQQQSAPKILGNTLRDGEGGIYCWRGASPYLKGNRISGHDEEAIFVDASSRPWLDRNSVTGNRIGLAIYSRDLPVDEPSFRDNGEDIRWLGRQGLPDRLP
ncbi:MAG: NosD domain-containing protein [Desulfuromonadales bacterium]|nr:NosD domain-containing protein [Desulfuromonadales bacterium]